MIRPMLAQHLAWRRLPVSSSHCLEFWQPNPTTVESAGCRGPGLSSVDRVAEDEASAVPMIISDDGTVYRRRQLLEHFVVEPRELRANLGVLQRLEEIGAGGIALTRSSFGAHAPESTAKDERNLIRFRFRSK